MEDNVVELLSRPLSSADVKSRKQGNFSLSYIETWRAIEVANECFGYGGWSHGVKEIKQAWAGEVQGKKGTRFEVHAICIGWLRVGDVLIEDVGYGSGMSYGNEGEPNELAYKEAVSDCLKRCLRCFGDRFGNCLYNKNWRPGAAPPKQGHPGYPSSPPQSQLADTYMGFINAMVATCKKLEYNLPTDKKEKEEFLDNLIYKLSFKVSANAKVDGLLPENITRKGLAKSDPLWNAMATEVQTIKDMFQFLASGDKI